jgi:hypothetical protein
LLTDDSPFFNNFPLSEAPGDSFTEVMAGILVGGVEAITTVFRRPAALN